MAWFDELNAMPDIGTVQQFQAPKQQKKKNFWLDQISTVGGILGGIGGSFIAPVAGTIGGSAAGSAAGEALENALMGESLGKNVLKEAALGGVFAVPPIKAGKALLAARSGAKAAQGIAPEVAAATGRQATQEVSKTAGQGKLTELGNKLLTSQYGTIGKPVARAARPEETFGELANYGLTKSDDVERVASAFTGANGIVSKAVTKAVGRSQRVPTDGIQQVFDDAVELNGLVDKDAMAVQSVFRAQMKKLMGGPGGSLRADANPSDVLDVMKALEKRAANLSGRGSNYRLSTPERVDQAKALMTVRDELEDRLFQAAGASNSLSSVLTPQLREQLVKLQPSNPQWQQFVDNTVMQSKDIGALRSSMAPFVRARQVIDEADVNSMTFGGRVGNAMPGVGGAVGGIVDPVVGALVSAAQTAARNPVARTAATALRSAGNQAPRTASVGRPWAPGIIGRVGAGGVGGGIYNQLAQGSESGTEDLEGAVLGASTQQDTPQFESPYSKESMLADIQRDPKNFDKYLELYQQLNPEPAEDNLSATQQEKAARAQNALGDIKVLGQAIDSGAIGKTAIPGSKNAFIGSKLGTTDVESALFNIGDVILRSRTGATAPESEVRAFVSGYLPRAGESRQSQLDKLQRAYRELQGMINPTPSLEDAVVTQYR